MIANTSTMINRYGALAAEIYDIDKPIGRLPDTRFYLNRLKGFERPILEPGCGSGRSLLPMLEAGLDVTGFDQSPDMLERCRAGCAAKGLQPPLDQQRLEDFRYARKFGAIVLPMGTFTLIDDLAIARSVLRRFWDALEPGGVLILDIPSLAHLGQTRPDRRRWMTEGGDLLTLEGTRVKTDWAVQRAEVLFRYERWRDNRLFDCEMETMVQRFWGVNELGLQLENTGFTRITVIGDYRPGRAPSDRDSMFTFEAVRP